MKKIMLISILMLTVLFSYSQELTWSPYINLEGTTIGTWDVYYDQYTTLHPPDTLSGYRIQSGEFNKTTTDYAGKSWSCTIWSLDLTDTIKVDFGGSNLDILKTTKRRIKGFEGYAHDSLPYNFIAAKHVVIDTIYLPDLDTVTIDTSYQQTFNGRCWPYHDAQVEFTNISDTTGTIGVVWNFSK